MKSRSKNHRRIRTTAPRAFVEAIEMLEQRMLLSVATLANSSLPLTAGGVYMTVDSYGAFGGQFPESPTLYHPFTEGTQNVVANSALYFQPLGGFLTETDPDTGLAYVLGGNAGSPNANVGLPGVSYSSQTQSTAVSTFDVAGFQITLTQTLSPDPSTDSATILTQEYDITNLSNAAYNNVPFNVVRYMEGSGDSNYWAGLSGDQRIAVMFQSQDADGLYQRIDNYGLDSSGDQAPDWETLVGVTGTEAVATEDTGYYKTIIANSGIPGADNGTVVGETNGGLLDVNTPPTSGRIHGIIALQDQITLPMDGITKVSFFTHTEWGDTGDETAAVYRSPGVWNIENLNTNDEAPEGTDASFRVYRTGGSLGHASVTVADNVWLGTAQPGESTNPNANYQILSDTDSPPNPIILLDGETATGTGNSVLTPDISIPVFRQIKTELSRYFFATISNPTFGATLANPNPLPPTTAQVVIPPSNFPAPIYFATTDPNSGQAVVTMWNEGQTAQIAVQRNADDGGSPNSGPYGSIGINYTITSSGSNPAVPGVDLIDNTPSSTLANGVYSGNIQFPSVTLATVDQNQYEYIDLSFPTNNIYTGPVTFTINLSDPDPTIIGTPSTFIGTIEDAQTSGPVHLQFASESVAEDAGSKTIGVIRSGSTDGQVTVDYTVAGGSGPDDAVPGVDFTVPGGILSGNSYTGTLTFDVDSSSPAVPLVIDLISTNLAESNKAITISLSDPNHIVGLLGSPSVETLTLTNNNTPGQIYFLGGATQNITEGPDPTTGAAYKIMTLQVTRDPNDGAEGAVSVDYSTVDGTAIAGTDYQAATGTLSWADGETGPKDIQVKVFDDTTAPFPRTNKTFSVNLSDPTGGAALATPSSVVVTIVDNQQPGVNLSNSTYTAYEKDPSTGQPGTANIVVERDVTNTSQNSEPWSFTYSVTPGSALPNVDYVPPTTTTVNVDASQSTYTITIPILADDNNTSDTNFTVRLTGATVGGESALGSSTSATVTITNADADVALASSTYIAAPGSGTVPIVINRTGRSDAAIIVSYTTADGTAVAGMDYTATSGSVTIPAGQNQVTVNVPILTPSNSTLPTRSFQFKITSAVLADPTDEANSITVNYSTTPSTVSIAGEVSATNIQLETGKGNRVDRVVVTFSDPLSSTGVNNPNNYVLTTIGKKGAFNSQIALTNALYNSATDSVTLYTKKTLSPNKLYQLAIRSDGGIISMSNQPFVTGAPGGLGGTQVATFATGSKIKYTDPDGDIVTLQAKRGGSMQFIDGINGSYPDVTVFGTTKTQLTGKLKAVGDGHTIIASITNPDGVQDLLLDNPLFSVE